MSLSSLRWAVEVLGTKTGPEAALSVGSGAATGRFGLL